MFRSRLLAIVATTSLITGVKNIRLPMSSVVSHDDAALRTL